MDNLENIIKLIKGSNNIIVFTGAGISTNCGIPDFRGEKGIYKLVKRDYNLPYPEAVFDINYFRTNPKPFFELTKNLLAKDIKPSLCHKLIADIENMGKLSLLVTQNIDMLHQKAGSKKIIECHGTYKTARCLECKKEYKLEDIKPAIMKDHIPTCRCSGIIKPDVVFFGEALPNEFYNLFHNPPECDLVLILGSSLSVRPAADFALELAEACSSVLVNLEATHYDDIMDYVLHKDLDDFAEEVWGKLKLLE